MSVGYCSKAKMVFQSSFMLTTVQSFSFASAMSASLKLAAQASAEEYPHHLFPADYPDQFVHRAIHGDEYEQKDLDGEEMRPDDYREQLSLPATKLPVCRQKSISLSR